MLVTWEFPKIRDTLFWGPYNKDPTIEGTILGSPIFGNPNIAGPNNVDADHLSRWLPVKGGGFGDLVCVCGP